MHFQKVGAKLLESLPNLPSPFSYLLDVKEVEDTVEGVPVEVLCLTVSIIPQGSQDYKYITGAIPYTLLPALMDTEEERLATHTYNIIDIDSGSTDHKVSGELMNEHIKETLEGISARFERFISVLELI